MAILTCRSCTHLTYSYWYGYAFSDDLSRGIIKEIDPGQPACSQRFRKVKWIKTPEGTWKMEDVRK